MKKILLTFIISGYTLCQAQQNEINFLHQNINFSAPPRTTINPMSIKMWDNYGDAGAPSSYGTVLEFYGKSAHQTGQLYFGGWDNSKIRYREAFYNESTWSSWITLLDSKNNLESTGNLMLSGSGNHFISSGNLGIGTSNPEQKLTIKGGGIGFDHNAQDKKLYSPIDGVLEWFTHNSAGEHAFAVSHQGEKMVYLNTSGASYLNGGNVGIGTSIPKEKLSVNGKIRAHEVKVETANWPDYVFEDTYKPITLAEIERFIKVNKHLPEVPSAKEVEQNGVALGEMNKILLKKIEELTLLLIEQNKKNEQQDELLKKLTAKQK